MLALLSRSIVKAAFEGKCTASRRPPRRSLMDNLDGPALDSFSDPSGTVDVFQEITGQMSAVRALRLKGFSFGFLKSVAVVGFPAR